MSCLWVFQGSRSRSRIHRRPYRQCDCALYTTRGEYMMTSWHIHFFCHYSDVIMGTMASQLTSLAIVYLTVYSGTDERKHQSSASLAFVRGIRWGPVNSPHKWPVTRKMFPFDHVIMITRSLWRETIAYRWIPITKCQKRKALMFWFSPNKLLEEQSICRSFETPLRSCKVHWHQLSHYKSCKA